MAKTALEKEIEKQRKSDEKAVREQRNRQIAENIVRSQTTIYGVQIMDDDAEKLLDAILSQYDGNENNHVGFKTDGLPRALTESIAVQYEKLKMYGVIASVIPYGSGAIITLSDMAKNYKSRKADALREEQEDRERQKKLETDYLKIQSMSVEQLREIYLQAVVANDKLQKSIDVQESQLQVLKDLFSSGEESVAIQEEIMRLLIKQEENDHPIRDYLAEKGGDIGVAALTAAGPIVWSGIKTWLASKGIIIP